MGGMVREKGSWSTTLSTSVVFTIPLRKSFNYFYIHVNYVDEIIGMPNANKGEMLHELE